MNFKTVFVSGCDVTKGLDVFSLHEDRLDFTSLLTLDLAVFILVYMYSYCTIY